MKEDRIRDAVVVGAGPAGLSAALYLGRALRDVTVVHHGRPMVVWEPDIQNYLGFPEGVAGSELLERGRQQAEKFGAEFLDGEVCDLTKEGDYFHVKTLDFELRARRVLIATGTFHRPPDIPGVPECLGHSLFFCKDCDGWRVRDKTIAVIGRNDDAVEYALALLAYTPRVMIATNNEPIVWDDDHARWLAEHHIPIHEGRICSIEHVEQQIVAFCFEGQRRVAVDVCFTTRGDVYRNQLALGIGAEVDCEGQVVVDTDCQTSVTGLYAAGCLTPANCQVIVAAGQGAMAAQAINRSIFEEDLILGHTKRYRKLQVREQDHLPEVLS